MTIKKPIKPQKEIKSKSIRIINVKATPEVVDVLETLNKKRLLNPSIKYNSKNFYRSFPHVSIDKVIEGKTLTEKEYKKALRVYKQDIVTYKRHMINQYSNMLDKEFQDEGN